MVLGLRVVVCLRVLQVHEPGESAAVWGSIPVVCCGRKDLYRYHIYIYTYIYISVRKAEGADEESLVWTFSCLKCLRLGLLHVVLSEVSSRGLSVRRHLRVSVCMCAFRVRGISEASEWDVFA